MDLVDIMKNLSITPTEEGQKVLKTVSADIDDVATEIVLGEYTDKTLLIISQYEKVGTMITVQQDQVHNPLGTDVIYTTKVIFGASAEEQQVAARYLAEAAEITNKLYLFINLKSYDIETVKACKDIILDLKRQDSS